VARATEGTTTVRNLLQVVTPARKAAADVSNATIKENVRAALKRDAALKDSSIRVKSVDSGVVLLAGDAKTLSDHVRALQNASSVDGVRRVASEIKSPNTLADAEIWRDGDYDSKVAVRSAASDMWTTTAVKLRLLQNTDTPGFDINVDTVGGVVTLFGVVDSGAVKMAASDEAMKVKGVKSVENDLEVVVAAQQAQVAESDANIGIALQKRFDTSPRLAHAKVKAEVKNGVARLTGNVGNQGERLSALPIARTTTGVHRLIDELVITPADPAR